MMRAGNTVYEKLGHAEVTQVELGGGDTARTAMQAFADKYFAQFRKTPFGMMRLVPSFSQFPFQAHLIVIHLNIVLHHQADTTISVPRCCHWKHQAVRGCSSIDCRQRSRL